MYEITVQFSRILRAIPLSKYVITAVRIRRSVINIKRILVRHYVRFLYIIILIICLVTGNNTLVVKILSIYVQR